VITRTSEVEFGQHFSINSMIKDTYL